MNIVVSSWTSRLGQLIFNSTLPAYSSETLNNFFSYNLSIVQTSFNNINNVFDKSYGNFYRNSDNSIKIEINKPFKETYIVDRTGIEIHDLDFNQKRFIKKLCLFKFPTVSEEASLLIPIK